VDRGETRAGTGRLRAAAILDPGAWRGARGLAVIPWSPLAGGWLTGRFRAGGAQPQTSRGGRQPGRFEIDAPENAAKLAAVEALALLAEQSGLSLIHLALGFVLEHPAVTAPIIGPRTFEQLEDLLGAAELKLTEEERERLAAHAPPPVMYPQRMLSEQVGLGELAQLRR
jgi:aryl-alcohol dehydrogenase-like predicted oxidoreductase